MRAGARSSVYHAFVSHLILAGHLFAHAETNQENYRHHEVRQSVEHNRSLWVTKPAKYIASHVYTRQPFADVTYREKLQEFAPTVASSAQLVRVEALRK